MTTGAQRSAPHRERTRDRLNERRPGPAKRAPAAHRKVAPPPPMLAVKYARLGGTDKVLLGLVLALVVFGLIMVFSASYYQVQETGSSPWTRVFKQGIIAGASVLVMLMLSRFDYRKLADNRIVTAFLVFSVFLLVLVLFVGVNLNGSRRWFNIKLPFIATTYQPSEQAKLALVLYMAASMSRLGDKMKSFKEGVLPNLVVLGLMCLLVMKQPNLSTTVAFVAIGFSMLLMGGAKLSHLSLLSLAGIAGILYLAQSAEYRNSRIVSFLNPFDPVLRQDESYQLVQSLLSLGAGGLFGVGPGMSRQKFLFLTYADSDFIFAIIAEEYGWVGCCVLLGVYLAIIWRGIRIAMQCPDRFGSLLAAGATAMLAFQVVLNVAVVTGSVPTTGMPLPFISAGGSSLLAFLACMGLLLSVSRSLPQRKPASLVSADMPIKS